MPILLINLLIGVSTGQLDEVLGSSEIIQFELQVTYSLQMQRIFLNIFRLKYFQSKFLVPEDTLLKEKNNSPNFGNENSLNEFSEIKTEVNLLKHSLKQNREDIIGNIYELNGKLQNSQETILEKYKEKEKRTKSKLEKLEAKFVRQFDLLALELN